VPSLSRKDELAPVSILYIPISLIQNNPSPYSPLSPLFYKFLSLSSSPLSKKLIVKVNEVDNVDFDVEMQPLNSQ